MTKEALSVHSHVRTLSISALVAGAIALLPGCGQTGHTTNSALPIVNDTASFAGLPGTTGQPAPASYPLGIVQVRRADVIDKQTVKVVVQPAQAGATGESVIDLASPDGLLNYITAQFPEDVVRRVVVLRQDGTVVLDTSVSTKGEVSESVNASAATFSLGQRIQAPPPGVTIDHKLTPKAAINAAPEDKADAVVTVASDLEGTPFVWGHNEDRGELGFDSSNFVAYVYHHALGYQMSGNANVQQDTVGVTVPKWDMRKGDLLIFGNGQHVGIYLGNDEMIQCGGGLGKVGVVSLGPDSEWGKHLTAVRRMY